MPGVAVMDYDEGDYDYRNFWRGRDFEHRTETVALSRLLSGQLSRGLPDGRADWFVDLGGGFGRHLPTYRRFARRVVLVDRSLTNLRNAAADPAAAGVDLVRADVYRLPLRDRAFDAGACVRLLHHLTDLDAALAEMGRVVDRNWLLDVPIHHHLQSRLRSFPARAARTPRLLGSWEDPYWNFHLAAVRDRLSLLGWATRTAASLHNLRGLPIPGPVARPLESVLQRAGRSWWGPSQFVLAERPGARGRPQPADGVEALLVCPACRGELRFDGPSAGCAACALEYRRDGGIWDFVRALPLRRPHLTGPHGTVQVSTGGVAGAVPAPRTTVLATPPGAIRPPQYGLDTVGAESVPPATPL